jgi:rod shape-determining protein MreC
MSIQGNRSLPVWIVLLVLLVIMTGYGLLRPLKLKPIHAVEDFSIRIFASILHGASRATSKSTDFFQGIWHAGQLKRDHERLSMELRLKNVELALKQNLLEENLRLRQLMKLDHIKDHKVIYADIVIREGANPYNFTINKGGSDLLKLHQAVVYPVEFGSRKTLYYQLLGRIFEILPSQSRVLSIMDERSQISVRNMRNQALGTLRYFKGDTFLSISVHQDNEDFQKNDILVSSELSTLPKGIIVGIVQEIESSNSLYKKVKVAIPLPLLSLGEAGVLE